MTKRRQLGRLWPVTPDQKKWARKVMTERGMTQSDLARAVKTTTAMISQFFDEEAEHPVRHSRFWPQMVAALGGVPPTVSDPSEAIDEHQRIVLDGWPLMSSDERAAVSTLVRSLTAKRSN
jgi:hypothetical protein